MDEQFNIYYNENLKVKLNGLSGWYICGHAFTMARPPNKNKNHLAWPCEDEKISRTMPPSDQTASNSITSSLPWDVM